MKTDYMVIPADESQPIQHCSIDWPKDPGFFKISQLIRPLLNGGWVERVNVYHDGKYTDMFVDEEGVLKGLPPNPRASDIYNKNVSVHGGGAPDGVIAGTAIVFDRRVWF